MPDWVMSSYKKMRLQLGRQKEEAAARQTYKYAQIVMVCTDTDSKTPVC
jgi:hypothetical protein